MVKDVYPVFCAFALLGHGSLMCLGMVGDMSLDVGEKKDYTHKVRGALLYLPNDHC